MNFSIRHAEADRWTVIDKDDQPVFTGSLRECEDWLDRRENVSASHRPLFRLLFGAVGRLFGARSGTKSAPRPSSGPLEGEHPADPGDGTRSHAT